MQSKEIKNKINSIRNIFEITKAVELVSAIKMKKAQGLALGSRSFTQAALKILKRLSQYQKEIEKESVFFKQGDKDSVLAIVVASDKGFCGAFNRNILNFSEKELKKEKNVEIIAIGKKAIKHFEKREYKVLVEFSGIGDYGKLGEVRPIADLLIRYFKEGKFKKILLFYTDFISTFFQKPVSVQVLPLDLEKIKEILKNYELKQGKQFSQKLEELEENKEKNINYIFEPSIKEIFENLVYQLIEYFIYHSILEANASEHSARMMAMRSASENAKEIMTKLKLEDNKARQTQITAEVTEISTAKEVLG